MWQRVLCIWLFPCCLLMLDGCSENPGQQTITLYVPSYGSFPTDPLPPIAVGSQAFVRFFGGYTSEEYCPEQLMVRVDSLSLEPQGHLTWLVDREQSYPSGFLAAHSVGFTEVTVSGAVENRPASGSVTVETRVAARARYTLQTTTAFYGQSRDYLQTCAPGQPMVARPGQILRGLYQELLDSQDELLAGEGLLPTLTGDGHVAMDSETNFTMGKCPLVIVFPFQVGRVNLVPPVGSGGLSFDIVDDTAISGIDTSHRVDLWAGVADITLWTEIAGAADCFWSGLTIVGTVETPDQCFIYQYQGDRTTAILQSYLDSITVYSIEDAPSGQCTIRFATQLGAPSTDFETSVTIQFNP